MTQFDPWEKLDGSPLHIEVHETNGFVYENKLGNQHDRTRWIAMRVFSNGVEMDMSFAYRGEAKRYVENEKDPFP